MQRVSELRHLVEEYYYTGRPSVAKFNASEATALDFATIVLFIYTTIYIVRNAVQGSFGWADAVVLVIGLHILKYTGGKVHRALFMELSGRKHGAWDVNQDLIQVYPDSLGDFREEWEPKKSYWIAELDRYDGNRDDEYHREFVRVCEDSQAAATAAVMDEHRVPEDDIIYIREVKTETVTVTPSIQVRSNGVWVDDEDDPIRVYTTWQLDDDIAHHNYDYISEQRVVSYYIGGILTDPATRFGSRSFVEMLALVELHELTHWALDPWNQPENHHEERGWNSVLWEQIDYIQDEQPDGPWYDEERDIRAKLTSREARENATERIPRDTEHRPPVSSQTESY